MSMQHGVHTPLSPRTPRILTRVLAPASCPLGGARGTTTPTTHAHTTHPRRKANAWVEDSAIFDVARNMEGLNTVAWWDWPEPLRFRQKAAIDAFKKVHRAPICVTRCVTRCARACVHAACTPRGLAGVACMLLLLLLLACASFVLCSARTRLHYPMPTAAHSARPTTSRVRRNAYTLRCTALAGAPR
jgi:hypothetical protein